MPRISILSRWSAAVLFVIDIEPNTLRFTLEAAAAARANLRGADLQGVDLRGTDLQGANLRDANFGGANLRGVNLGDADLGGADLGGVNLGGANLGGANLRGANLRGAYLRRTNLRGANLRGANLGDADLGGANLRCTDLRGANLRGANLRCTDLRGANLVDAKNAALVEARTLIVPESGAFEGWKLCQNNVLVHLRIPADAQRSSATGRKCRAEFVEVIEVIGAGEATSLYDNKTLYYAGAQVQCDQWDATRWKECSGGIHFYLTRIEAEHHT